LDDVKEGYASLGTGERTGIRAPYRGLCGDSAMAEKKNWRCKHPPKKKRRDQIPVPQGRKAKAAATSTREFAQEKRPRASWGKKARLALTLGRRHTMPTH